nr:hypothetical protein CFP56_46703 [Quercus suber]
MNIKLLIINDESQTMRRRDALRQLLLMISGFTSIALFLLWWKYVALPVVFLFAPRLETLLYDLGAFGAFRFHSFKSFNLSAPRVSVGKWEESCNQGFVLLDLNGPSVNHRGPLILDARGQMIWTSDAYGVTINSKVQRYKGENYLTFWAGAKAATSGKGIYYMVAAAGSGLYGDLHEFMVTADDTALLTVYNTTKADLSSMGMWRGENGWIVDSIFQEVDISTGVLLFEWKASDHYTVVDSYMTNPLGGYMESSPFDFFHINSVEKDFRGNYLISSRHLHMIIYIEGGSGNVLWALGGHATDFLDVSHGAATNFRWQHDARWLSEDDGIISLFDNGVAWPHMDAPHSQGLMIQLNTTDKTVSLLHSYQSLQHTRSSSQGSLQQIAINDAESHIFIGWGSSAAFSEFSLDGRLLCETHFGASWLFFWERVKSYRASKVPREEWKATPSAWGPAAEIRGNTLYVSWNGATEVAYWSLQGTFVEGGQTVEQFESLDVLDKVAFESSFLLPSHPYSRYRVAALDADQNVLGMSNHVTPVPAWNVSGYHVLVAFIVVGMVFAGALWSRRHGGWTWKPLLRWTLTIIERKYPKVW